MTDNELIPALSRVADILDEVGRPLGAGIVRNAMRAIEQHEAFRRELSEAMIVLDSQLGLANYDTRAISRLIARRFIIPKPVDPVENVMRLVRTAADDHVIEAAIRGLVGKAAPEDTNHD